MRSLTFQDIERCRRCPLSFRFYDAQSPKTLTLFECMDLAVRETVRSAGERRVLGESVREDQLLSEFWDRWDASSPLIDYRRETNKLDYIRLGETCIRNYARMSSTRGFGGIAEAGMRGTYRLSDDISISVSIDEVARSGDGTTIVKYVTEPVLWSKEDLGSDREMSVDALWAYDNIPGADHMDLQWVFLHSGTSVRVWANRTSAERNRSLLLDELESLLRDDALPRETYDCRYCRYRTQCPRFLHEISLASMEDPAADRGVRLVDRYAELSEKIGALDTRRKMLETERDAVAAELAEFANASGYMSVTGSEHKVLVRHEKKVDFPEDKTELVEKLKSKGLYDGISMVNYPRLRSDIAKGTADPEIAAMAKISRVDKLYMKRRRAHSAN
ncbi:MAG: hypothetical protein IJ856_07900 [Candidatus Methanomethylophilaceae archaeon]|nr:hypothetical protein [Candidatus Methanomethylophilaceae archaeon]